MSAWVDAGEGASAEKAGREVVSVRRERAARVWIFRGAIVVPQESVKIIAGAIWVIKSHLGGDAYLAERCRQVQVK